MKNILACQCHPVVTAHQRDKPTWVAYPPPGIRRAPTAQSFTVLPCPSPRPRVLPFLSPWFPLVRTLLPVRSWGHQQPPHSPFWHSMSPLETDGLALPCLAPVRREALHPESHQVLSPPGQFIEDRWLGPAPFSMPTGSENGPEASSHGGLGDRASRAPGLGDVVLHCGSG